jgi:hypothetical protein
VDQLGPNAVGEMLEPGRVAECYLGLLLPPGFAGEPEAGTILIVAPAALLHPQVPQPDGSLVYELLTGHPEREPGAGVGQRSGAWMGTGGCHRPHPAAWQAESGRPKSPRLKTPRCPGNLAGH